MKATVKNLTIEPSHLIQGQLSVPGDKSISHRSVILGSIAQGRTEVSGFLEGEDCLATLQAFQQMGVQIERPKNSVVIIHGVGKNGLKEPTQPIDLGNSGTSIRLLTGLMSGCGLEATLTGDASLVKRPMQRIIDPLMQMGAAFTLNQKKTAPIHLLPHPTLQGITYNMPMASAQVKSCLLLAGLYAQGKTIIYEPAVTRDHTERLLETFGYPVEKHHLMVSIENRGELTARSIQIPGDISSAAFFIVAATIAKNSRITITNVGINPTRIGIIHLLRMMGANITMVNERCMGAEPVADLIIESAPLNGIEIPQSQVSLAIDEFPILFIAAACAKGKTILRNAHELRVKESDRIDAMAQGLRTLGINTEVLDDGIIIEGGTIQGGIIECFHDHRVAMAFAIASIKAQKTIVINECENIMTSFPNFVTLCASIGMRIHAK